MNNIHNNLIAESAVSIAKHLDDARLDVKKAIFNFGDVAALKRMNIERPAPVFWRVLAKTSLVQHSALSIEQEKRWALAVKAMAILSPHAQSSTSFGLALLTSNFSSETRPARINKLLSATSENFDDLFLIACKYLSQHGQGVDWSSLIWFVLDPNEDRARNKVARDFFTGKE